jgi:PhzF family phenazine biosynthesis protein
VLPFSQVDVFTDKFTLGNPVAVIHDADELTDDQMAHVARWTNLSETTFLLRPTQPGADYRLRIFTPGRELPFAGHPTLGSARAWLAAGGKPRSGTNLVQECGAGLVQVRSEGKQLRFAAPALLRSGPVDAVDIADAASAVRIPTDDVVEAQWADNGPGWLALLLPSADYVLALRPDPAKFADLRLGVVGAYPPGSEFAFEVRAFAPSFGVGEDPATGSLNAAIAGWLMDTGRAGEHYVVSQGTALNRKGRVHIHREGTQIWVGGDVTVGVSGQIAL